MMICKFSVESTDTVHKVGFAFVLDATESRKSLEATHSKVGARATILLRTAFLAWFSNSMKTFVK
jgi:hypothetical protein